MATLTNSGIEWPSISKAGRYEPFELQVSRAQITNHQYVFRFGWANAIGTAPQTITTVVAAGSAYVYPAAATTMQVSSDSANDTSSGTGARTILVAGLDANYNAISEVVTLSGTTQVATTNQYLRIQYTELLTTGSNNGQVGTIYFGTGTAVAGVPPTVYWRSEPIYNNWSFAGYTVPAGYTAYVTSYTITSQASAANINISLAFVVNEFGKTFSEFQSTARLSSSGTFDRHFDFPLAIAEKSDFQLRAWAASGTVNVTGEIQMILIANDSAF